MPGSMQGDGNTKMNKTQSLPLTCSVWVKDRHRPPERIRKRWVNTKLCEGTGVTGALSRGIRVQLRWTDISLQGERPEGWEWGRQGANWGEGGNYRPWDNMGKSKERKQPLQLDLVQISYYLKTPALWHVTQHLLRLDAQPYVWTLGSLSH